MDTLQTGLARSRDAMMSLPPACYSDPAHLAVEDRRIFADGWIGLGRADMVAGSGDYQTLDIAGHALIILRDKAGVLHALANACRHRGARLLDGAGTCRGLRCPFHSWAYRLDGTLVAAPHMEDAQGFDRAEYGLISHRIEERAGFAFLCLNPDAPSLDDTLGNFAQIHAPWPLEKLVSTRRQTLSVNCNWKAFLEVFNEYYHLPFVHPDSVNALYARPDAADTTTGAFASQFGATMGTGGLLQSQQQHALPAIPGLTGEATRGARYTWVFPNMTFAANTDGLWVYEAYPDGPDRCHVVQTACFPPETLTTPGAMDKVAAYHDRLDAALAEDIPALENQHRGLCSPDARQGPFQPLLEANVAAFARWYAGRIATA